MPLNTVLTTWWAYINIRLTVKNQRLEFSIENTADEDRQLQSTGGIGLSNFRKRLGLYYTEKHTFEINSTDGISVAKRLIVQYKNSSIHHS